MGSKNQDSEDSGPYSGLLPRGLTSPNEVGFAITVRSNTSLHGFCCLYTAAEASLILPKMPDNAEGAAPGRGTAAFGVEVGAGSDILTALIEFGSAGQLGAVLTGMDDSKHTDM